MVRAAALIATALALASCDKMDNRRNLACVGPSGTAAHIYIDPDKSSVVWATDPDSPPGRLETSSLLYRMSFDGVKGSREPCEGRINRFSGGAELECGAPPFGKYNPAHTYTHYDCKPMGHGQQF